MTECFTYISYLYSKFVTFIFETCNFGGWSLGWVAISVVLLALMIRSILNIPKGISLRKESYKHE